MTYWSVRNQDSGWKDGYRYVVESVRRLRADLGQPERGSSTRSAGSATASARATCATTCGPSPTATPSAARSTTTARCPPASGGCCAPTSTERWPPRPARRRRCPIWPTVHDRAGQRPASSVHRRSRRRPPALHPRPPRPGTTTSSVATGLGGWLARRGDLRAWTPHGPHPRHRRDRRARPRAAPRRRPRGRRPARPVARASCSRRSPGAEALIIRSATEVTAEVLAAGDRPRRGRPGRHRPRQRRRRGRHRAAA